MVLLEEWRDRIIKKGKKMMKNCERKESDAEFLDGKEARIILTIGTWD